MARRCFILIAACALAFAPCAQAQAPADAIPAPAASASDIVVTAPMPPCPDDSFTMRLACLNAALAAQTASPDPRLAIPDVRASPLALGLANEAAARQRMGVNFGVSVHPQRPSPPPPASGPLSRSP